MMSASNDTIRIRPATLADLPAIVAMRDELNELELHGCPHAPIHQLTEEQFRAFWGHTFGSAAHCWRIVEADGQPIGFGLIYVVVPRVEPAGAYLHWAFLRPNARRSGVGQKLFAELAAWARDQGVARIELQFIEGNQFAQRFWAKMGFRPFAAKCVHYLPADPSSSSR